MYSIIDYNFTEVFNTSKDIQDLLGAPAPEPKCFIVKPDETGEPKYLYRWKNNKWVKIQ